MQHCLELKALVRERVQFFIENNAYKELYEFPASLKPADCYVLYFPDQWLVDIESMLIVLRKMLNPGGVLLILESEKDGNGFEMCIQADRYKAILKMSGVVNQLSYHGELDFLQNKKIELYQFWKKLESVELDALIQY